MGGAGSAGSPRLYVRGLRGELVGSSVDRGHPIRPPRGLIGPTGSRRYDIGAAPLAIGRYCRGRTIQWERPTSTLQPRNALARDLVPCWQGWLSPMLSARGPNAHGRELSLR